MGHLILPVDQHNEYYRVRAELGAGGLEVADFKYAFLLHLVTGRFLLLSRVRFVS
jgi:hypothetical protein